MITLFLWTNSNQPNLCERRSKKRAETGTLLWCERSSVVDHNIILIVVFNAQYDLGRHEFISAARRAPNLGQYAIDFRILYAA